MLIPESNAFVAFFFIVLTSFDLIPTIGLRKCKHSVNVLFKVKILHVNIRIHIRDGKLVGEKLV